MKFYVVVSYPYEGATVEEYDNEQEATAACHEYIADYVRELGEEAPLYNGVALLRGDIVIEAGDWKG